MQMPPEGSSSPPNDPVTRLFLALAQALHDVGEPSHRLEATLYRLAARLGERIQVFCLPTGMWLSIERDGQPRTYLLRASGAGTNLERLTQLTRAANDLIRGRLTVDEALARIEAIRASRDRWGPVAIVAAYVLSAAAFSVFFGGAAADLIEATEVGLAVGLTAVFLAKVRRQSRLFELVAASAAAAVAGFSDWLLGSESNWVPLASGLIILLPGFAIIDGVEELANGHLTSGASRIAGAMVVLLALAFGSLIGATLVAPLPDTEIIDGPPLSDWAIYPALVAVALGSTARFRARPRDVWLILAASAIALFGSRLGDEAAGELGGPFLAALALSICGNLYARVTHDESELMVVPGLAVLVPGSAGFRSVASLAAQDAVLGIEEASHMVLVATALVAGLLFGNSIVREPEPG